ncbi:MAG: hypothetical protein OXB98_13680 [Bryobacterales bacterium]|nr:hypothetical protein [Bryobacterales bacterium]
MSKLNGSAAAFALAFQNVVREAVREELVPISERLDRLEATVQNLESTVYNHGLQLDRIEKHLAPTSHVP